MDFEYLLENTSIIHTRKTVDDGNINLKFNEESKLDDINKFVEELIDSGYQLVLPFDIELVLEIVVVINTC